MGVYPGVTELVGEYEGGSLSADDLIDTLLGIISDLVDELEAQSPSMNCQENPSFCELIEEIEKLAKETLRHPPPDDRSRWTRVAGLAQELRRFMEVPAANPDDDQMSVEDAVNMYIDYLRSEVMAFEAWPLERWPEFTGMDIGDPEEEIWPIKLYYKGTDLEPGEIERVLNREDEEEEDRLELNGILVDFTVERQK